MEIRCWIILLDLKTICCFQKWNFDIFFKGYLFRCIPNSNISCRYFYSFENLEGKPHINLSFFVSWKYEMLTPLQSANKNHRRSYCLVDIVSFLSCCLKLFWNDSLELKSSDFSHNKLGVKIWTLQFTNSSIEWSKISHPPDPKSEFFGRDSQVLWL